MNRRSILSSLSSMCLAALAWPRNAAGGDSAEKNARTFTIKVKNARVIEGGMIVSGQYPLNVWAYDPTKKKTLTSGAVGVYTRTAPVDSIFATIYAGSTGMSLRETSLSTVQVDAVLYYLAYADSPTGTPTITKAPAGVTF